MKTFFIAGLLYLATLTSFTQQLNDTTLYYCADGSIVNQAEAPRSLHLKKTSDKSYVIQYKIKNKDGSWEMDNHSEKIVIRNFGIQKVTTYFNNRLTDTRERKFQKINDSLYSFHENNGPVKQEFTSRFLIPIIKTGTSWLYYPNGKQVNLEFKFENNRQTSGICYSENGELLATDVYGEVDVDATFNGGDLMVFRQDVQDELKYPQVAIANGIVGKVYVQFVVIKDGTVSAAHILKGVDPSLDNESIRAILAVKGKWIPGYINKKPVNLVFVIPIIFSLT